MYLTVEIPSICEGDRVGCGRWSLGLKWIHLNAVNPLNGWVSFVLEVTGDSGLLQIESHSLSNFVCFSFDIFKQLCRSHTWKCRSVLY